MTKSISMINRSTSIILIRNYNNDRLCVQWASITYTMAFKRKNYIGLNSNLSLTVIKEIFN